MNYIFRLDDGSDKHPDAEGTFVVHLKIDEFARPRIGTELKLPVSSKTWRVIRVEPPTNPEGQQNTYFIEEV